MQNSATVRVGVGVLVLKDGKVLLGKRKGSHGEGEYGGPGGHVEFGETAYQTALREIKEECGITVKNLQFLCVSDLMKYRPKQYIDIGFTAEWESGEPEVLEPHKLVSWGWYDMHDLPGNCFGCLDEYLEALETGKRYFTVEA